MRVALARACACAGARPREPAPQRAPAPMNQPKAPRRRITRKQLAEAAREIERRIRSNQDVTTKPKQPEPEERPDQTMHLRCDARDLANLDEVAEFMKADPIYGRLRGKRGRENAARYAIAWCVANHPRASATG